MTNQILIERIFSGRRAELKRIILLQALSCFLEKGIEATTIEMIRDRAEASVGVIYHHFKNKEGIISALFFAALDDQSQRREEALLQATSLQQGIISIVESYIDWVEQNPDFASFLYTARLNITENNASEELQLRNQQRNQALMAWFQQQQDFAILQKIPHELLLSLVIGATESYCRAWLSNKVKTSPQQYKSVLAQSAWNALIHL
ncbi:TetR/AcrR family transcriptional regulator [Acinetobacter sp. ANC 3832]|uniref:TetR/AcrR family transcriptional regulator n=1 Tax=Acinetobacter sp. ANC 3832 TaxID=1977874 RepID=UPI000A33F1D1|nr:TetR/AcrR family transcriptional regulator [Acinetobacter sp. ANC 3832]OTG95653.1 TetR family transcriptional regulator [Acinetobacter sp. ANC 3832]